MSKSKQLSKKLILISLISLSAVFFMLSFSVKAHTREIKVPEVKQTVEKKTAQSNTTKESPTLSPTPFQIIATHSPTSPQQPTATSAVVTATQAPSPAQQQPNQITVTINGAPSFTITTTSNSNQCDVLKKAFDEGRITSLNMRYDNNLNTYGVYQINGLGRENQVWWTYKVNGQSPTQGCSYVKANNNDSVTWKYIGPN